MSSIIKSKILKNLITSKKTEYLIEAHSAISAKISQEAGFKGLWASGLAMSALLGVRDNNELSWTQVLDHLEFMADVSDVPILVDGDSGYGNFNNVRRFVKKLETRGLSGICLEDKIFPKTNSFISTNNQILCSISEFIGKIKAAKDTQKDPNFCVVARTEAFITGQGLKSALERAYAYYEAGADAILVHSKSSDASEIISFMKAFQASCPIIIVPTTYSETPSSVFEELNVSVVIFANHLIRASVKHMQTITNHIWDKKSVSYVEKDIVSVNEIFRLQQDDELRNAEKIYLPNVA